MPTHHDPERLAAAVIELATDGNAATAAAELFGALRTGEGVAGARAILLPDVLGCRAPGLGEERDDLRVFGDGIVCERAEAGEHRRPGAVAIGHGLHDISVVSSHR